MCIYETDIFYLKNYTQLHKIINYIWNALKINAMLSWTLLKILLMSAVIWEQKLLYENEIVQCIWNYKCYDVIMVTLESHYKVLQIP